jgi:hypothetical protein
MKRQKVEKGQNLSAATESNDDASCEYLWKLLHQVVDEDNSLAWKTLYDTACQDGESMARAIAAFCFFCDNVIVPESYEVAEVFVKQSHSWLDSSVHRGCKYALFLKAMFIYRKIYYEPNDEAATELCKKSADQGLSLALNFLGCYYGKQGSVSESRKYLEIAATAGYRLSQRNLGLLHVRTKDYIAAAYWFHEAADNGSPTALNELAKLYLQGYGVPKDIQRAVLCLSDCSKLGDQAATSILHAAENAIRDEIFNNLNEMFAY